MKISVKCALLVPCLVVAVLAGVADADPAKKRIGLSPHEEEVTRRIGFGKKVAAIVKEVSGEEHVNRMTGYDAEGYQIMADGITVAVAHEKAEDLLASLRARLRPLGYMAFIIEVNEGIKTDTIGVLKGTDQYQILRVMQTNGKGDDVANEDIIAKLKGWEKCSAFMIVGAENDWVEIEFTRLPVNIHSLAEEVQEFAPDAVDDVATGLDELVADIRKTRRLFLWWE
jgi:hypothetical protein